MNNNCITNLLRYICLLQDNSMSNCLNNNSCDRPFLGINNSICYNTRIISIYRKDGSLFTINNNSFFRVMNVTNNCCKLLILNNSYQSTNEFIEINISCIGAVRCISDVYISNI